MSCSENQVIELPYPDLEQGRYRLDIIVQDIDLGESSESQHFLFTNKIKAAIAVFYAGRYYYHRRRDFDWSNY